MSTIRHAMLIAAPAAKVFDALTTTDGLAAWWTPRAEAIPEIGSTARFPFGLTYVKAMTIEALRAGELVRWRCTGGAEEWIGTTIIFALEQTTPAALRAVPELGGQVDQLAGVEAVTLLRFAHEDWRAETLGFAECSYTWARFLRSLKLLCETGRGTPWPEQHQI